MKLDPLKLPEGYIRYPVRLHPQYHRYLKLNAWQANLDMADIMRVLVHLSPQHAAFQEWINKRKDRFDSLVVIRDPELEDWGPLK